MIFLIRNHLKQYRLTSLITICFTIAGVISEMQIPYTMGRMIDDGIEKGDLRAVVSNGLLMLFFALFSLGCGYGSAFLGAYSATGFAANLRESMFAKIQDFSFANIDRFSGAGLVTRLTSDVSNLQNAYQMLIRLSMRGTRHADHRFFDGVFYQPPPVPYFFGGYSLSGDCHRIDYPGSRKALYGRLSSI